MKKILSLIAIVASVALSQNTQECETVCPMEYAPVCGSDGHTYVNECALNQKKCLEKSNLVIASEGECYASECSVVLCTANTICVPQPKQCVTTPCNQFACLPFEEAACANIVCPQSTICSYEPKECFTTPCPQFACLPALVEEPECPEMCAMEYAPVCGSDGQTYNNECTLSQKKCLEKSNLVVASVGECEVAKECIAVTCLEGNACVFQPKQCVTTPCDQFACLPFEEAACANVVCPQSTICSYEPKQCFTTPCPQFACVPTLVEEEPECPEMCTTEYVPVCGSNFRTYSNLCQLQSEACRTKSQISSIFEGECSQLVCNENCPKIYAPVCGSDENTYGNLCMLQAKACLLKTPISVASEGECPCNTACAEIYAPVCGTDGITYENECTFLSRRCLEKSEVSIARLGDCQCPEMCTKEYKPVCGTNKATYGNLCMLKLAACEGGIMSEYIKVAFEGECPDCREFEMCIDSYEPVCGSNGITYSNLCALKKSACELKSTISVVNDGECVTAEDPCPLCIEIYQPVCGIDLNTYSNKCFLERENCELKRDISILHEGQCSINDCPEVCTDDYKPVCGSDGVTYGNICSFLIASCKTDLKLKISNMGGCPVVDPPCMDMCAEIYAPVCGSNGITYENECRLSSVSCHGVLSGQKSISAVSKGDCLPKGTKVSWDAMIKFDMNDDLTISNSEFNNFISAVSSSPISEEEANKLFIQVDSDGNKQIDNAEYKSSESFIQSNSVPSSQVNHNSLYYGLGFGIGTIVLAVIVVGAVLLMKRNDSVKLSGEEASYIPHTSHPYQSLN